MDSHNKAESIIIYKQMAPEVGLAELKKKIGDRDYVWLLRESRVDGMLTVQVARRNKSGGSLHRLCLTGDGWKDASTDALVAALRPQMIEVGLANIKEIAGEQLGSLFVAIEGLGLQQSRMVIPSAEMQSRQNIYSGYAVPEDDTTEESHILTRSGSSLFDSGGRKRTGSADISDKELLALIVDPVTQKIMSKPVTFRDGTVCDLSTVGPDLREGVDFVRNHTLGNIIKYINVLYSEQATRAMKEEKLESLRNDIQCPVSLSNFSNPVLLSTGHCLEREMLDAMIASGRSLKCPKTNTPILAGSEISDKTTAKFMELWPALEHGIEEKIRQMPQARR